MANEKSEDTTYSDANVQTVLTTAKQIAEADNRNVALVVFSAWFEKYQEAALKRLSESIQLFRSTEPMLFQKFIGVIKQTQEKLAEDYDHALAVWQATQSQEATKKEPAAVKGQTIFIIANSSAEAKALAKFIEQGKGEACTVISMDGVWYLERELAKTRPDIVIADTIIDNKLEAENIMRLVRAKNPEAKFVFTSEEAAITEDQPKGDSVMAVLEKPFHFNDVLDVMNGTYADRVSAAGVRFKIEESTNIVNRGEKVHTIDKPGIIKVWDGYAAPQFQKNMLTRIRTKTDKGPYRIDFDKNLDDLIDFACQEAKNDNAVTILPSNKLSKAQRERLETAGAHVIYIDFKDGLELGTDDIIQIGVIVFTGIAYLNNNDNALMGLYKLLTGEKHDLVTIEQLKKNPSLLIFIFEPTAIHNYNELKHLNDLMEKEILSAA